MPRASVTDRVRVFGIRHHGPGSARSLVSALDEWQPDAVLIEGPSDVQETLPSLTDPDTRPPVAILVYASENPRTAFYYPFAEFSPEYQALRWAAERGASARFIDLPAGASLGYSVAGSRSRSALEMLSEADGFDDVEDWWEQLVEQRADSERLFEGVARLMGALRESETELPEDDVSEPEPDAIPIGSRDYEAKREAHMRREIRAAMASFDRVAVVCGAWHSSALRDGASAKQDDDLLRGLPKVKVGKTLIPWTFERLTFTSGYGAGVRSPEFYNLLWKSPSTEVAYRWLLQVARLIREEDLDASPAVIIEAVRLADALASLRGRPRPGLRELYESARSVIAADEAVWRLIERRLIVGERMGEVASTVPAPPLHADLAAQQKRLRMKVDDQDRLVELDLRNETDLDRSRLLHRLTLLDVTWGLKERVVGKKGTFHENWRTRWRPELVIDLVEAGRHGNTVLSAATNFVISVVTKATSLSAITAILESALLADLEAATEPAVERLQALSATTTDVSELIASLAPLSAILRYGTVRKLQADRVQLVADAIFTRICVGLPAACVGLDDESAAKMAGKIETVSSIVQLADSEEQKAAWITVLARLANLHRGHPLLLGKAERLRFDLNAVDSEWLALRLGQEASRGATALETAAFVEGLLTGSGAVLIHHRTLFEAVDAWVGGLDEELFDSILPLVRRTFAQFTKPERRQIGEIVSGGSRASSATTDLDWERAQRVLPVIRQILGMEP